MVYRAHQMNQFLMDDSYNLLAWIKRFEHLFTDSLLGDVLHEVPHDFKTYIRFQQLPFDEFEPVPHIRFA